MKQIILIIFLLCLPLVPAINWYAGNQESITLDFPPSSCIMVDDQNNSLTNYTTDGLNLTINGNNVTISTNPALMPGNYTLVCNYSNPATTPVSSGNSGGSGGGGYTTSWICGNWSECINNTTERICIKSTNKNINYTQSKSCISETKEPEEKKAVETDYVIANYTAQIPFEVEFGNETKTITIDTTNKNTTKIELPTEEEQGWVYLGIIIITLVFIVLGVVYFIGKSNSES